VEYDRESKLALYAQYHIPEYWIVSLVEDCIERYWQSEGTAYAQRQVYRKGESITSIRVPQLTLAVDTILIGLSIFIAYFMIFSNPRASATIPQRDRTILKVKP
jgi:Uma2 family endonuclease